MALLMLPYEIVEIIIAASIPPIDIEIENDSPPLKLRHTSLPQLYVSSVFRQCALYYIRHRAVCRLRRPDMDDPIPTSDGPYSNCLLPSHIGALHVRAISCLTLWSMKVSIFGDSPGHYSTRVADDYDYQYFPGRYLRRHHFEFFANNIAADWLAADYLHEHSDISVR